MLNKLPILQVNNVKSSANNMLDSQELHMGEFSSNADKSSVEVPNNVHYSTESMTGTVSDTILTESCVAEGHNAYAVGKSVEVISLMKRYLIACMVHTIPPRGLVLRYADCQVKGFTQFILAVMKSNEKSGLLADNEARDLWRQFLPPSRMLPFGCKFFVVNDLRNSIDSIT
ncbi:hypothetical protein FXO38_01651 [Capsicum annuum]|nr:hypothetical protein FXO38_01651 [Capsicum annuum]